MEEYTISKDWEDLVGQFFDPNNKAARHLLEYASEPVIVQILLNIPSDDLEAFCSINKRVRRICKSGLVKKQYYEKNPTLETDSYAKAKAFLKQNPKGLLLIKSGEDFTDKNLVELADKIVHLEGEFNFFSEEGFTNLKILKNYHYGTDNLYQEINYKNGKKEGLYRAWHDNGQLEEESNYNDGKLNGLRKEWEDEGQLIVEENYKNGKRDGLYRTWDDFGSPKLEATYKNDKLNGLKKRWRRGKLTVENYKDGKLSPI
jgi:antitoxin component YwqK of YwqJK toxin-antitoxin module